MVIVKMQRSLTTTADSQQVLIYNEARTIWVEQSITLELSKWFGTKDKVYAKANYKGGIVTVQNLVKAQAW